MPVALRVPIPPPGADLPRFFGELLGAGRLAAVLDVDVTAHDELAQVTDVRIGAVVPGDAGVAVHYFVCWETFHACSGQAAAGESARVARGRVAGADWLFEPSAPLPARDTLDEF